MEENKKLVFASVSHKGKKICSYAVVFKREVVSYTKQHSIHAAAQKSSVDRNTTMEEEYRKTC